MNFEDITKKAEKTIEIMQKTAVAVGSVALYGVSQVQDIYDSARGRQVSRDRIALDLTCDLPVRSREHLEELTAGMNTEKVNGEIFRAEEPLSTMNNN